MTAMDPSRGHHPGPQGWWPTTTLGRYLLAAGLLILVLMVWQILETGTL